MVERLNDCFGENGWFATYDLIERRHMVVVHCHLQIPRWKIQRHAFGGNANEDRGDAYKGAATDALTKAASHLGIAGDVYKGAAEVPEGTKGYQQGRKHRQEYGVITGVVNRYELLSPSTLYLLVDQTQVRAIDKHTIQQLQNSQGKRVELRCRWDVIRKQHVMTVLTVMGVWEPVPSKRRYERTA